MSGSRIAVVGASGNVGTAVLRALARDPHVSHVRGISRRTPSGEPYDAATWIPIDIAQGDTEAATDQLTAAFEGCDAVVHLVWAIQPNTRRSIVRRTNVEGTRRVLEAAARAGVGHVVSASSIAAYSRSSGPLPRDERFPVQGIPTSHYSVDKVAQEQALTRFAQVHPEIAVARMRTSLVFQAQAGAEVARLFVGPFLPLHLALHLALRLPLPVLPLPRGLRLQATHADDIGEAYALVLRERAAGAFNVAAEPVLDGVALAALLAGGRVVELPVGLVRGVLALAWSARLVAADPGWLDMAMSAPIMDTARIRALGWRAERSAADAVLDVVEGMRMREGTGSPALRPADRTLDDGDLRRDS